jgi:amino acid adenylation domain-containing protein
MVQLIQHWVTRQAESRPDATAIVWKQEHLTYGDLDDQSNRLANLLRSRGATMGDRVAFCIPKSPAAIVAMLGILKADCVYVPIDVECPSARVQKVLDACEPVCVLVSEQGAKLFDDVVGKCPELQILIGCLEPQNVTGQYFVTDFSRVEINAASPAPREYENQPSAAAHILFTSGSTGTPKGVVITHANVIAYIDWTLEYFGVTETDRVSGHAPLHFDLSTQDIYGAFAAGAELYPVPPEINLLPQKVATFIENCRLTQWFSVPSVLNYLCKFDVVPQDGFPHLKRLMWCGEVLPTPTLIYLMRKLPTVQFTNLYGPTEATIASSYYTVTECPQADTDPIPIGRSCDGEELLVLDEQRAPVAPGETGDLYIAGAGLSPGYWRDPHKTDSVFLKDPGIDCERRIYRTGDLAHIDSDGLVWFHGRADTQIKSRGYRIELGEIETALNAIELLECSAVVAIETGGFENMAICCAWIPTPGTDLDVARIKVMLAEAVPRYMLPKHWMKLERMPRNANGKIDRPQLRTYFAEKFNPVSKQAVISSSDSQ